MVLSENDGEEIAVNETQLHSIIDNSILEPTEDLLKLNELHESTLLYNIRARYMQDKIYTYVGPIVIALNPFKKLPLYTDDVIRQYHDQGRENMAQLPPHIYTIAENSYDNMLTSGGNQSILISGESGAGKVIPNHFKS